MSSKSVRSIAVIGAGVMGRGIALIAAKAGFDTRVIEPNPAAAASARGEIEKIVKRSREKGEWDDAAVKTIERNLQWVGSVEGAKGEGANGSERAKE